MLELSPERTAQAGYRWIWTMTNNSIKTLLEAQETLRRQLEPLSATMKALGGNSALRLARGLNRQQELVRAALGPVEELRRAGLLNAASQLGAEYRRILDMVAETEKHFRLPEIAIATKLFLEFENTGATNAIKRYHEQASELQHAMDSMRAPWLDMEDKLRSIGGFVGLQGIGHALRKMPAFDTRLTDALRIDLGDWRKKISWPANIFIDPLARTSFYAKRGLDPALTKFPAKAFEQSIAIAGLKGTPPPLVQAYNYEPEVEAAFERTNAAHDRLQRFETQIRQFIDEQMKPAFGENWIKHQVPGKIRQAWLDKRQKARDNGAPQRPLIAYADFADYVPIITRKDNWQKVFEPIFGRAAFVQESFQRLYPIRICTMHARLITQDDELYLYVETKRILAAIGNAI